MIPGVADGPARGHSAVDTDLGAGRAPDGALQPRFGALAAAAGQELHRGALHVLREPAVAGVQRQQVVAPGHAVADAGALAAVGGRGLFGVGVQAGRHHIVQAQGVVECKVGRQLGAAQAGAACVVQRGAAAQAVLEVARLAFDVQDAGARDFARLQPRGHALAGQALHVLHALLQVAHVQDVACCDGEGIAPGAPAVVRCAGRLGRAVGSHHADVRRTACLDVDQQLAGLQVLRGQGHTGGGKAQLAQFRVQLGSDVAQAFDAHTAAQVGHGAVQQPGEAARILAAQGQFVDGEAGGFFGEFGLGGFGFVGGQFVGLGL